MSWKGRSALVTGAGGFIGSHLVEALQLEGVRVRALVHYNAQGSIGNLRYLPPGVRQGVEIVAGDIRDPFAVRAQMGGMDSVFHLAALIGIPYSYVAPASYVETNISGTLNVLEAARAEGCERIVVTSTSETYGTAQYTPIDESHPLVGQSPYSASKIGADQLAISYHRAFELPVRIVRPFNTFGPRQSERAIIPTIVSQALHGHGVIHLGSLDPKRDLTFVQDTVAGFLLVGERPEAVGTVTNLGMGEARSVREMVEAVGKALGRTLNVQLDAKRVRPEQSEVQLLCADSRKARSLGWSPRVTFEDGIAQVVDFLRENRTQDSVVGQYRI